MKKFLRALACTVLLSAVAAAAQAQARVFVGVRAPFRPAIVAAIPACPGVGYVWTPGYYTGAIWYPGRWVFRGYAPGYAVRGYGYGFHRGFYYGHGFYRR
jgi:hypothetical protein